MKSNLWKTKRKNRFCQSGFTKKKIYQRGGLHPSFPLQTKIENYLNFYDPPYTNITDRMCLSNTHLTSVSFMGFIEKLSSGDSLKQFHNTKKYSFNIIHTHGILEDTPSYQIPPYTYLCFLTPLNYHRKVEIAPLYPRRRVTRIRDRLIDNPRLLRHPRYFQVMEAPSLPTITEDPDQQNPQRQGIDYFLHLNYDKAKYIKTRRSTLSQGLRENILHDNELYHSCFESASWYYPGQECADMRLVLREEDKEINNMGIYVYDIDETKQSCSSCYEIPLPEGKETILLSEYLRRVLNTKTKIVFILSSRMPPQSGFNNMTAKIEKELCCLYSNWNLEKEQFLQDFPVHPLERFPLCAYQNMLTVATQNDLDFSHSTEGRNSNLSRTIPNLQEIFDDITYSSGEMKPNHINYILSLSNTQIINFLRKVNERPRMIELRKIVFQLFPKLIEILPNRIGVQLKNKRFLEYYSESHIYDKSELVMKDALALLEIIKMIPTDQIDKTGVTQLPKLITHLFSKDLYRKPFRISDYSYELHPKYHIPFSTLLIDEFRLRPGELQGILDNNKHITKLIFDNCSLQGDRLRGLDNIEKLEFKNYTSSDEVYYLQLPDFPNMKRLKIVNSPTRYLIRRIVRNNFSFEKLTIQNPQNYQPEILRIMVEYNFNPSIIVLRDSNFNNINLEYPKLKSLELIGNQIRIDSLRVSSHNMLELIIEESEIADITLDTPNLHHLDLDMTGGRISTNLTPMPSLRILKLKVEGEQFNRNILSNFPNVTDFTLSFSSYKDLGANIILFDQLKNLKKITLKNTYIPNLKSYNSYLRRNRIKVIVL